MIFIKLMVILGSIKCVYGMFCTEDIHCAVEFYCDLSSHTCQKCHTCYELNRLPPKYNESDCVRTNGDCGPCFENFIKYFDWSLKCLPALIEKRSLQLISNGYFWITLWIFIGCTILISAIFIQYIFKTNVVIAVVTNIPNTSIVLQKTLV